MKTIDLKPRAVAALCALRCHPRTSLEIRSAIGDQSTASTRDLLGYMRALKLVIQVRGDERWYLDHDGLGWLESHGLTAAEEARAWNTKGYELAAL